MSNVPKPSGLAPIRWFKRTGSTASCAVVVSAMQLKATVIVASSACRRVALMRASPWLPSGPGLASSCEPMGVASASAAVGFGTSRPDTSR